MSRRLPNPSKLAAAHDLEELKHKHIAKASKVYIVYPGPGHKGNQFAKSTHDVGRMHLP